MNLRHLAMRSSNRGPCRAWCSASLVLALALLLSACGGAPAAAPADSTGSQSELNGRLSVLDWSGYELPEFWQAFADQYPNARPEYTFFVEDAEAFAKLQSGFDADLVHPCAAWWGLYVDEGLVQPIDTSKLKNWTGIDPELAAMGQFDGKQYFAPYDWGYESILVRTDKVTELPTSWADLANPEYAGHLALWDSGEANHIIGALALGFDPWNTTAEQEDQIQQWLVDLKPNVLTYWVDFAELAQMMAAGDVWVASNAWADTYKNLLDEGVPVEYVEPEEGKLGWVCGYGISSKAENPDLALAYIDARLAPDAMATFSNAYGYGAANRDALPQIDPATIELFQMGDPAALEQVVFYQSLTAEQRQQMTTMWNEVKAAP